jgi:polyisoprenoid-binding protein YceI
MSKSKWSLDPTHSELGFRIKHLMISNVSGYFTRFSATAETSTGDFSDAQIEAQIEVASINTNNEQRDAHLRNADFFEAEKYPYITFRSTRVEKLDDSTFQVTGDLTIKETTKPVKLVAEYGDITKDPWGNTRTGFSISGKINRKDFGVSYNAVLESGGLTLGEELKLFGEIQLVKEGQLQEA